MSKPGEPFDGSDFNDTCEDCLAPAGHVCFDDCPSGYSSAIRERHVEQLRRHKNAGPCDEFPACGTNCACK